MGVGSNTDLQTNSRLTLKPQRDQSLIIIVGDGGGTKSSVALTKKGIGESRVKLKIFDQCYVVLFL